ncbi:apolipoprotein D-like [Glandiceps talaboti]
MAATYITLLLVTLCYVINGQIISFGKCPSVSVQENFNVTNYLGTWHEIKKFPAYFQRGLTCVQTTYKLKDDGNIQVLNEGINSETGKVESIEGVASTPNPNEPAKLKLKLFWWHPADDYWVLHTNYQTFSIVYSCSDLFGFVRSEFAWILSRKRTLDDKILTSLLSDLQSIDIDIAYFQSTDQTGCVDMDPDIF